MKNRGIILNGKRAGFWVYLFNNGRKIEDGEYRNGLKEGSPPEAVRSGAYGEAGLWSEWFRNGEKEAEKSYRNGERLMRLSSKFSDR